MKIYIVVLKEYFETVWHKKAFTNKNSAELYRMEVEKTENVYTVDIVETELEIDQGFFE